MDEQTKIIVKTVKISYNSYKNKLIWEKNNYNWPKTEWDFFFFSSQIFRGKLAEDVERKRYHSGLPNYILGSISVMILEQILMQQKVLLNF